jgi:hypothetical protein
VSASGAHYAAARRHSSEGRGNGGDGGSEALRVVARSGRCWAHDGRWPRWTGWRPDWGMWKDYGWGMHEESLE